MKTNLLIAVSLIFVNISTAQLANQNTYLLKNLDTHGEDYASCWGYAAPGGREYAILGCYTGTSFVDITDSANIYEADYVANLSSQWHEMKTYSHYAYIVSEAAGSALQIIDLQYLPDSAHFVKTWSYPGYTRTHSISQSGHYLYLNGGNSSPNGGITIVDVINPENPVKLGQWTSSYVHDCRIRNDTIWASNSNTFMISVIDATNKNNPFTIRTWGSPATTEAHNSDLTTDRKYLISTSEMTSPVGKLHVSNIEDIDNITYITQWQPTNITSSIVHNVDVHGSYAIVAHYSAGIRILSISNPEVPVEIAWYDTYPANNSNVYDGCWAAYKFPSGKIIGSDISNGLFVIKTNIYDLNHPPVKMNLKVSTEGLYDDITGHLSRKDTVTVFLRNISSPYSVVDSAKAPIDSLSLRGSFKFSNTPTGTYYIVVKHFNGIETWSKFGGEPVVAEGPVYNYDFTSSDSQAFGNNLKLKGGKYLMFSGDVDKSNSVTLDDVLFIYNDALNFSPGIRLLSDLNGDNVVDLSDLTLVFNNANEFVSVISPGDLSR